MNQEEAVSKVSSVVILNLFQELKELNDRPRNKFGVTGLPKILIFDTASFLFCKGKQNCF